MLIELHKSLIGDSSDSRLVNCLEYSARAYSEGRHAVIAPRPVLRWAKSLSGMSACARGAFEQMLGQAAFVGRLRGSRLERVCVYAPGTAPAELPTNTKERPIHLATYERFAESSAFRETVLLAEDLEDCDIIAEFAAHSVRREFGGGMCLSFEPYGGGGSRTARALDRLLASMRITICVVDSDKASPSCGVGSTALSARRALRRYPTAIGDLIVLKCRETENLFGRQLLRRAATMCGKSKQFDALAGSGVLSQEAAYFFDLKEGGALGEIEYEGFGDKLLTHLLNAARDLKRSDVSAAFGEGHPSLHELAKSVSHWCLAFKPSRA